MGRLGHPANHRKSDPSVKSLIPGSASLDRAARATQTGHSNPRSAIPRPGIRRGDPTKRHPARDRAHHERGGQGPQEGDTHVHAEMTVTEMDALLAEQLPARELMTGSNC